MHYFWDTLCGVMITKFIQSDNLLQYCRHNLDMKIIRNVCDAGMIVCWARCLVVDRRQELQLLHQVDSEQEDLIPCQQFSHAIPLANTKRNQSLILAISQKKK